MNEIEHDTRVIVRDNQPRSLRRQLPAVIRLGCCRIALAFARTEASPKSFIHAIKFAFKNSASSLRWRHFDSLLFKLPVPFERSTIPPEDLDSVGARVRHQTFMQISFRRRDFSRILPRTSSKPSKFHPLIQRALATRLPTRGPIMKGNRKSLGGLIESDDRFFFFFFFCLRNTEVPGREAWF